MGFCSLIETTRVISFLKSLKLPTSFKDISISITPSKMIEKIRYDKKNKNNQLTFILNKKIGKSFIQNNMDINVLTEFLDEEI